MEKKITPTLTLAHLYESQKQYFDAFTIYNLLYRNNQNVDILDKMKAVEKKIFHDMSLDYNSITQQIFTDDDREKFRILPEVNFTNLKDALENKDDEEPIVFKEEEFLEPDEDLFELETIEDYTPEIPINTKDTDDLNNLYLNQDTETIYPIPTPNPIPIHKTENIVQNLNPEHLNDLSSLTLSEFANYLINVIKNDKRIADLTLKEIKEIKNILTNLI